MEHNHPHTHVEDGEAYTHSHPHEHDHDHDQDQPHEHEHDHEHEQPHDHEQDQDPPRDHDHGHEHPHTHNHPHIHDRLPVYDLNRRADWTLSVLRYMLEHNVHHKDELRGLADTLDGEVREELLHAVEDFMAVNDHLAAAVEMLEEQLPPRF